MAGKRKKADQHVSKADALDTESDNDSSSEDETRDLKQNWSPASKKGKKVVCQGGEKPCGREIDKNTENVVCDGCGKYYHIECQGISTGAHRALKRYDDIMTWLCPNCKPKLEWLVTSKRLEERIEMAEKKILKMMEKMEKTTDDSIKEKMKDIEGSMTKKMTEQKQAISENSEVLQKVAKEQKEAIYENAEVLQKVAKEQKGMEDDFTKVVKSINEQQQVIKKNTSEMEKAAKTKDMEARAMNIIIHNIEESEAKAPEKRKEDDAKKFTEIAAALGAEQVQVENIIRLNWKQGGEKKKRLMMVKMKNVEDADLLFRRRYNLKSNNFENVYITKDLPPEERERQRKLREELKEKGKNTHIIFRGKVVPRRN